ncbi:SMI1/KNR4 family protein [Tropicibacter alexandrii]|uniref:SMI1/KNR4 family protein n=1 Tax=Tropicibacter alexandrii TaxID=2267683 RepID=UPI000EF53555|nr:SMI1/KNR4 family protein [Tropicibacter alexandrii]
MLEDKDWQIEAGATESEIAGLIAASAHPLPADYLSYLNFSNGGEGPLSIDPQWLVLDNTALVAHFLREGTFAEFFPGLVVIGSNGAGEAIAFDFRQGVAKGVVCFDMTNIDSTESIRHLAASFTELMSLVTSRGA